jgi:hypothetical protein
MKNLIEQTHEIKIYGRNINFYKKHGINCKFGDIIKIKSFELNPDSRTIIKCICEECQKEIEVPFNRYMRCKKGFICSPKCRAKRTKKFLKEKYNIDNVSQLELSKIKKIEKSKKKYGVDNVSKSDVIKNKKTNTSMKHFGVSNVSKSIIIKNKKIVTSKKHYGVDYPFQAKEVRDEYIKNIQKKYGSAFTNISQISEIMDKKLITGIHTKKYSLPSGKIVKIQGYENYGIEYLLNKGIEENDIIIGNKEIEKEIGLFFFYDSKKEKNRRYFPDIFVKSENKIYEVKSTYTMKLDIDLINMKKQSVVNRNFNFEFLVFNNKGIKF